MLAALALAPCALLLAFYLRRVRSAPEPWTRVVACTAAGAGAFAVVVLLSRLRDALPALPPALESFVVVGPLEETVKLAAILVAAGAASRWERVTSGLIYGAAVGVGFAAVENVVYVQQFGAGTAVLRALTAVPGHTLHTAIVGVQLGTLHRAGPGDGRRAVAWGLLLAAGAHGTYDALLHLGAPWSTAAVLVLAVEAVVVLALFRRALEDDLARLTDALRRVSILADAPASVLRELASDSVRSIVRRGALIVRQGGPGDTMFLILRGRLSVVTDGVEVAQLGPGDVMGEGALLRGDERSADVRAVADGVLLRVDRDALYKAVAAVPELASRILAKARERSGSNPGPLGTTGDFRKVASDHVELTLHAEHRVARRVRLVPLLREVPAETVREIAEDCLVLRRGPSLRLVGQGRAPIGLALVFEGEVEVLRDGAVVATLVEGDYFGEAGLLTGWPALATVRTRTPVELGLVAWSDFAEHVGAHPEIGRRLLASLDARADDLRERRAGPATRPGVVLRALEAVQRRVGLGAPAPATPGGRALAEALPDLAAFPAVTADALADLLGSTPAEALDVDAILAAPERLESALAKSPDLLRFLARRAVAPTGS